jgi:hypothetical protein
MNHLIIGLGGTGGRVVRAFRKLVYQRYREEAIDGVEVDYLFVDSNPSSFAEDDPSWTVLGRSVQLPKRSQMLISEANLSAVVDDLNSHPNLKPWLGDRRAWGEILSGLNVNAAGGQKRRLGRFLFAMKAGEFVDRVSSIVQAMQDRGRRSAELTIHIVCGLAGGTGSGALIDAVAQLRQKYPDPDKRVILYTYMPDINPPQGWNTGNYHANAYAALLELNAMAAGAWAPFDVVGGGGPVRVNSNQMWFNGCYVFSDENEQGYRASINNDLPDLLADFIFQKTIVARQVNWAELQSVENSENGDAAPETANGVGKGLRSVRFLSFGVRSLAFPEEAIRERLSYDFVKQSLDQLRFNNWQDSSGYLEQARPLADAEFVADARQREDWRITDDHLRLSRPIIDMDGPNRWRPYEDEWQEWQVHSRRLVEQSDKLKWLDDLKKLYQMTWTASFRGQGVEAFFKIAERDRGNYAQAIRNRVEQTLFEDWRNGARAVSDCRRVVDALILDVQARLAGVDAWIGKRQDIEKTLQDQLLDIEQTWPRLIIIPGGRERLLDKASLVLRELYCTRTLAEAGRYSKRLGDELGTQLEDLRSALASADSALGTAADEAQKIIQSRFQKDGADQGEGTYVTTLDSTAAIEKVERKLVLNQEEMRTHTAAVRAKIAKALGQQQSFSAFSARFKEADLRNIIVVASEENVGSAHQRLISDKSERIVGVSVIDKLCDMWGENQDRINKETAQLVRTAGRFAKFDQTEQNKSIIVVEDPSKPAKVIRRAATESLAVIMPMPPEQKNFVDMLQTGFRNARSSTDVKFISSGQTGSSVTVVNLTNLFPLRFVRLVRSLRAEYLRQIELRGAERVCLEVHGEGTTSAYPELFMPDAATMAPRFRPLLLLGLAWGPVVSDKNGLMLLRKDEDGFDLAPVKLGATLDDAADSASEQLIDSLRTALVPLQAAKTSDDALAAGRTSILAAIEQVKARYSGDVSNPSVIAWNDAARDAMKVLKKETTL